VSINGTTRGGNRRERSNPENRGGSERPERPFHTETQQGSKKATALVNGQWYRLIASKKKNAPKKKSKMLAKGQSRKHPPARIRPRGVPEDRGSIKVLGGRRRSRLPEETRKEKEKSITTRPGNGVPILRKIDYAARTFTAPITTARHPNNRKSKT